MSPMSTPQPRRHAAEGATGGGPAGQGAATPGLGRGAKWAAAAAGVGSPAARSRRKCPGAGRPIHPGAILARCPRADSHRNAVRFRRPSSAGRSCGWTPLSSAAASASPSGWGATRQRPREAVGKHHLLRFESGGPATLTWMHGSHPSPAYEGPGRAGCPSPGRPPPRCPLPLPLRAPARPGEPLPGTAAAGPDLLAAGTDPAAAATAPRAPLGADAPGGRGARGPAWWAGVGTVCWARARPLPRLVTPGGRWAPSPWGGRSPGTTAADPDGRRRALGRGDPHLPRAPRLRGIERPGSTAGRASPAAAAGASAHAARGRQPHHRVPGLPGLTGLWWAASGPHRSPSRARPACGARAGRALLVDLGADEQGHAGSGTGR